VFTVSWTGSERGLVYDVDVSYRRWTGRGFVWSAPMRWLTGWAKPSAVYAGRPVAASPGQTLRFVVHGRDAAGNSRTAAAVVTRVPLDDRNVAFRYSAGWQASSSPSYYLRAARVGSAAGRSVTVSALADRIDVLGDRCAACGQIRIYADGRYVRTIDTRAAGTQRRAVLVSVSFARLRTHKITLVVVGTSGRPRVAVDGAALYR
jgi:hypothetical protein